MFRVVNKPPHNFAGKVVHQYIQLFQTPIVFFLIFWHIEREKESLEKIVFEMTLLGVLGLGNPFVSRYVTNARKK